MYSRMTNSRPEPELTIFAIFYSPTEIDKQKRLDLNCHQVFLHKAQLPINTIFPVHNHLLNDPTITGSGFHTIEIGAIRNTYFLQHQQSNQLSSLIIRFVSFGTTTFSPPPLESPFFPSCVKLLLWFL